MSKPFFFSLEPRLLRRPPVPQNIYHVWHRAEESLHQFEGRCCCDPVTEHTWERTLGQIWIHRRMSA